MENDPIMTPFSHIYVPDLLGFYIPDVAWSGHCVMLRGRCDGTNWLEDWTSNTWLPRGRVALAVGLSPGLLNT